jgi:hypothetical protein
MGMLRMESGACLHHGIQPGQQLAAAGDQRNLPELGGGDETFVIGAAIMPRDLAIPRVAEVRTTISTSGSAIVYCALRRSTCRPITDIT